MQAKDIPVDEILRVVDTVCRETAVRWRTDTATASLWHVQDAMPDVPPKVVLAKLRTLVKQDFSIGCRGDFALTELGTDTIARRT